jgi:hypothetical protein
VMSVSLQSLCGDLSTAARSISVFPINMQTPVASTDRRRGKSTQVCGMPLLTEMVVPSSCSSSWSVR